MKEAQAAWMSASENEKNTYWNFVQSAARNVQSAERMRDFLMGKARSMMAPQLSHEKLVEKLELVLHNEALIMQAFLDRYTLTPVSHYSSETDWWILELRHYYRTTDCLILQQLFPDDFRARPWWLKQTNWNSIFPAVGERIIPKRGYTFIENELGIKINEPRNGLLLLRHLEHAFQDGDWVLIPEEKSNGAVKFKIYVSQELKQEIVRYKHNDDQDEGPVRVHKEGKLKPLTFAKLHEHEVWICPPPFLRALFLKARMAWKKHQADEEPLPDPNKFAKMFTDSCDNWNQFMVAKMYNSLGQMDSA